MLAKIASMVRSLIGASLAVLSVIVLLLLHAWVFSPMIASPSCPSTALDPRFIAVGAPLLIAGAGAITAATQLRLRVTATAAIVVAGAGCVCLVYAFLLVVLFFCSVPGAY
jgi:hypothetical protein